MDNDQTTITALRAALADRDQRIAELTETCLNAADKIDATEARVAAAVAAERAAIRAEAKSRIVGLHARGGMILADVLDAIDAAGGAP